MNKDKKISFRLTEEERERVEKRAAKEKRSLSNHVRNLVVEDSKK